MTAPKVLTWLASPFGIFVFGLFLAGAMAALSSPQRRRLRTPAAILYVAAGLQLVAFSWFPIADFIVTPLENRARRMSEIAPAHGYAAILLLGGVGQAPPEGSGQNIQLNNSGSRVWLAARLFHNGLARRIVVSGGSFATADGTVLVPEAESIRSLLLDLGVPAEAIVLESRSSNTYENARESKRLIDPADQVALVTSAYHMWRAMREMQLAGIHAYAFPTDFQIPAGGRLAYYEWLPNSDAQHQSTVAIKEWLGIAASHLRGE